MIVKPLSQKLRLVTYTTIFMGIVSYGFTAITARNLETSDAARLLVIWTLLNILLLIFQFPIETYSPRFEIVITEEKITRENLESFIASYCLITGALTMSVISIVYTARFSDKITELIVINSLILSMSIFFIARSIYFGQGNLKALAKLVTLLAVIVIVGLTIYTICGIKSAEILIMLFSSSYILAAILDAYANSESWVRKFRLYGTLGSMRAGASFFVELKALMLTNMVSLLLLTGGVTLGEFVGVKDAAMITYIGLISLAMVPFSILNSATSAILLRNIEHVRNRQYFQFVRLFKRSALVYLGLVIVFSFGALLFSSKALEIFLGSKYNLDRIQSFWIFTSVGLAVLAALPIFLLTSLGVLKKAIPGLILTVITYLSVLGLIRSGVDGLNAASIVASLLLFSLSTYVLLRESKVLAIDAFECES